MAQLITIAPQGDTYITLQVDTERCLVRVSRDILMVGSPYFEPLFDGQWTKSTGTKEEPIELIDDNSTAMTNLFRIFHWRRNGVDTSAKDWLQQLAIVANKYMCADRLVDLFEKALLTVPLNDLDKMMIYAILGNEKEFSALSEQLVRLPKSKVEAICHKGLLELFAKGFLDDLVVYRREARSEFRQIATSFLDNIYQRHGANQDCVNLSRRLNAYWKHLYGKKILVGDLQKDSELQNLNFAFLVELSSPDHEFNKWRCTIHNCICQNPKTGSAGLRDLAKSVTKGTTGGCTLCYACFKKSELSFERECDIHKRR